ncbi:hypothetical protein COT94_01240 [Candidatus Falkowbacteria bacterium CG10_big_fil_rev_8_21_14_0_10_37_14]|uniref:3D domain-containing protein n=1 Tax=Candidatus Falkowbacteria bacterium CG10_big_fil_rev_8_21_14_0_10_37_14 TaxID=1974561 RepID=A0A2M6WU42_9BACT|nr:hypothetical protein [Candidatus Falkowbacteria bacterium]PIT96299.1 MAG: hypothetical protein COT94_01240 [Candidatus Falkowbacteria bacterium CG10_big_fil_rev_8_21_14_0_10_37_14]
MKNNNFYIIITIIILLSALWLSFKDNNKVKLARESLLKPIGQVIADYAAKSCINFSPEEIKQGYFEALVTGYCRPESALFTVRQDFLCAVGLNCSCPAGRSSELTCLGKNSLAWAPCLDFDDKVVNYCDQTASQLKPQPGFIAADWNCFKPLSTVNINNQDYQVADKGSAITGRRFDLWIKDCGSALNTIGIYKVKLPQ